jgi:tetratricopeptide (TPR) repeat protein
MQLFLIMTQKIKITLAFTVLVISFISGNAYTQSKEQIILKGMDHMYHMRLDSAKIEYDMIVKMAPKDPAGYFYLSLIEWWKIIIDKDNDYNDEKFFNSVEKVIDVSEDALDRNENDENALFYKGGAIGYRGLVHSFRESWLKAAEDGRKALSLFQDASEINPGNKEVIFGNGIYNYFAEYVPEKYPFLKPLLILFPKGDKVKGLMQIKETATNSTYAKTEAKLILSYLYLRYEKNYKECEYYSNDLYTQYPENPVFAKYLYNAYVGDAKFNEAVQGWKQVLQFADENRFGFNNKSLIREANYYIGFCLMHLGQNEESLKYLLKSEQLSYEIDKGETMIKAFTILWLGVVDSRLGNKEKAKEYFNTVLKMENFGDSHQQAEIYLSRL